MANSPILLTPRLRIEPFTERFLTQRYLSWLNDPDITRFSDQRYRIHTIDSCRRYLRSFRHTPHFFWAAIATDPALGHIGNLNAYVDLIHSVADVGILIGEKAAQRRGYATEAWLATCDYLLRIANVRKVTAGTVEPNQPMLKLMHRTQMIPDGRRPRHCLWNNQEVDVIHAAFYHDDWLKRFPTGPFNRD